MILDLKKWEMYDIWRTSSDRKTLYGILVSVFSKEFQQYFSYIMTISFIGGGNQSTQRNPPPATSHWHILLHNVVSSTPRHELDSHWQCEWIGTESIDSCKSKYHAISTTTALVWPLSKNDITHKTFIKPTSMYEDFKQYFSKIVEVSSISVWYF